MNSNKQLFTRFGVYLLVFVLVAISYINFTNNKENELKEAQKIADLESQSRAIEMEEEEEETEDEAVLGEIDIEDVTFQNESN